MTQYARPDQDIDDDVDDNFTDWTDQAGGSSLYDKINEASADDTTTYIKITDGGDDETCLVRLSDVDAPGSAGTYIKYKARASEDMPEMEMGPPGLKLELLQGSTVKATTTNSSVALGTFTDYSYEIEDVSGISDWADLKLQITMISNAMSGDYMHVTQAYLETQDAAGVSTSNPRSFSLIAGGALGTSFSFSW